MSDCCPDQITEGSSAPGVELLEGYLSERRNIIQQLASSSGKTRGEVQLTFSNGDNLDRNYARVISRNTIGKYGGSSKCDQGMV